MFPGTSGGFDGGPRFRDGPHGTNKHQDRSSRVDHPFERFTTACARFAGRPAMLFICMIVAALAVVAFVEGSDQLMWGASLATSFVTVLLLPILQETQNRDSAALHAKIDELIKTNADARNALIGLENRPVEEIEEIRADEEAELGAEPDRAEPPLAAP